MEASGARICVFSTGGIITLTSGLVVTNPYLYIAGQSAPGGGITLKGQTFTVEDHDVLVRYVSFRRGPGGDTDGIFVGDNGSTQVYNVVFDHCSMSWAVDEVFNSWYRVEDLTLSYCIISEGLHCSTHSKGCHSAGAQLGGYKFSETDETSTAADRISFHHNLMAHNSMRGPVVKSTGTIDIRANVTYNSLYDFAYANFENANYTVKYNFVKNYYKKGPDSPGDIWEINPSDMGGLGCEIYVEGNIGPNRTNDEMDEDIIIKEGDRGYVVESEHTYSAITEETTAGDVYTSLTTTGRPGNSKYVDCNGIWQNRRDAVDTRIVSEVIAGTGSIINCVEYDSGDADCDEAGEYADENGWPTIAAGSPCTDTDSDGMPDAFEIAVFGDLNQTATGDYDSDGYNNIEEYLDGNGIVGNTGIAINGVSF